MAKKRSAGLDNIRTELAKLLEVPESEEQISNLLRPLSEPERREFASLCIKRHGQEKRRRFIEDPPGTFGINPLVLVAGHAVFWVCSFSEIRKAGWTARPDSETVLDILRVRRPAWIDDQVNAMLADQNFAAGNWKVVRQLVREKLCTRPEHPRYYVGMIVGLSFDRGDATHTVLRALNNDPELLKDDVWKLFEYEGEELCTLVNVDRQKNGSFTKGNWADALKTLSRKGKLSRPRLLQSTLSALMSGFSAHHAKWFVQFFDFMEPTAAELRKHSETILSLVSAPALNVAEWAFEHCRRFVEQGVVSDVPALCSTVAPLLLARTKGAALNAVKFLEELSNGFPKQRSEVCLTVVEALAHEKAEVQKHAFQLIQSIGDPSDDRLLASIQNYQGVASAVVRKQISAWLASSGVDAANSSSAVRNAALVAPKKKTGTKRVTFDARQLSGYSTQQLSLLRIPDLVQSLREDRQSAGEGVDIPATIFNGTEIPRLDPGQRIEPVADLEELLEVLGLAIEDATLVDEGERALAGLARLSNDKPDDFQALVGPLVKRARGLLKRTVVPFSGYSLRGDLTGLILAWSYGGKVRLERKKPASRFSGGRLIIHGLMDEPFETWDNENCVQMQFLSKRSLEIADRLNSEPWILLSAPTHKGGWIDPVEFVDRINELRTDPDECDVILAMLRLAPENRGTALKRLKPAVRGEWLDAVRHALGGRVRRAGSSPHLWAAAARSRAPFDDDAFVQKAFPQLGTGCATAAEFVVTYRVNKHARKLEYSACISTPEVMPKVGDVMLPTLITQVNLNGDDNSIALYADENSVHWLKTLWPGCCEMFFAGGAQLLFSNLDWWEAEWGNKCFMEPLLDPGTPPRAIGLFMLLCGLAAKEPGEHGLAVDILIQAISDGRVGTDCLGEALAEHLPWQAFNFSRLAKRFGDIAAASDLHSWVVFRSWERAIAECVSRNQSGVASASLKASSQLPDTPRGMGDIFEMLVEIAARLGCGITLAACRTFLQSITGSGKVAKSAKQLAEFDNEFDVSEVLESAIRGRVEHLDRWVSVSAE
ncbi:MAG: DUF6493 family protein [Planctomycetaceae bacterium]